MTEPPAEIARIIDEHSDLTAMAPYGKRNLRVLGRADLLYLQALNEVGEFLTPSGRRALHEALYNANAAHEVSSGAFVLALDRLQARLDERLAELDKLKNSVGGYPQDPCIKGTGIEIYRISALLDGGESVQEVMEDDPGLRQAQIEVARDYAAAVPKKGRPYPKLSFKRATMVLNLGELDKLLAEERGE